MPGRSINTRGLILITDMDLSYFINVELIEHKEIHIPVDRPSECGVAVNWVSVLLCFIV